MKVIFIWSAIILLLITSTGGFYGGYQLVAHPDGSTLKIPLEVLQYTPFKNFFTPGILLFIFVGILGALAIIMTLFQVSYFQKYIIAAGLILTVWVLVYMALAPEIYRMHYVVLFTGIAQLLCGIRLDRKDASTPIKVKP